MELKTLPKHAILRLYQAAPAVLLGTFLNALDAASTGLLIFPSAHQSPIFEKLQVQSMSIYLMSTIVSQLTMTLGGSLFPGALGSMLVEILPFLRGIASDIQDKLGSERPSLLPTVMAAYAMTSVLVGGCLLALGLLRLGWVVEYFPSTVLTGTIGAIGLSLFILALQLTLPQNSAPLTLSSAGQLLFDKEHIPLIVASIVPTVTLCVSLRLNSLSKLTRGFTEHAIYVPAFVFTVAGVFWIAVAAMGNANAVGMTTLASQGWLFSVQDSVRHESGVGMAWNYWALFDFSKVEWSAMSAATQNIVLLVIIGVLNLPIYIPAMALVLGVPKYNMDWELIGHGASNLASGVLGSVPNLVVLSNSRLFTSAGGGRLEALIVTGLTIVLFFASSRLLPYIPTIQASVLVLFLGLELMIEALWSSAKELLWCEWCVVVGTLLACTFVGFLPGFGIGIGLAIVVHVGWDIFDSRARVVDVPQLRPTTSIVEPRYEKLELQDLPLKPLSEELDMISFSISRDQHMPEYPLQNGIEEEEVISNLCPSTYEKNSPDMDHAVSLNAVIIALSGNPFFATIPPLERHLDTALSLVPRRHIVIDLTSAHRAETCIGKFLLRKLGEHSPKPLTTPSFVLSGVPKNSGLHADLGRGGLRCVWDEPESGAETSATRGGVGLLTFATLAEALQAQPALNPSLDGINNVVLKHFMSLIFSTQAGFHDAANPELQEELLAAATPRESGVTVQRLRYGDIIMSPGSSAPSTIFVVRGKLAVVDRYQADEDNGMPAGPDIPDPPTPLRRLPLNTALASIIRLVTSTIRPPPASLSAISPRQSRAPSTTSTPTLHAPTSDSTVHLVQGDIYNALESQRGYPKAAEEEVLKVVSEWCWVVVVAERAELAGRVRRVVGFKRAAVEAAVRRVGRRVR